MCTLFLVVPLSLGDICAQDCSTVVHCRRSCIARRLRADADRAAGATAGTGTDGAAADGSGTRAGP